MLKLGLDFYRREDVVKISKELLGKVLCTNINGSITKGIITETEAYAGISDRASHAWNGRRTQRTETMYAEGGVAYVYLCYGMYNLFNVVTNKKDIPDAVLIRGVYPFEGIETILKRRKKEKLTDDIASGPGTASIALGIDRKHNGLSLVGSEIWIEDHSIKPTKKDIVISKRIGVDYAGEDAKLPYNFKLTKEFILKIKERINEPIIN